VTGSDQADSGRHRGGRHERSAHDAAGVVASPGYVAVPRQDRGDHRDSAGGDHAAGRGSPDGQPESQPVSRPGAGPPLIRLQDITRTFSRGSQAVRALRGVSLDIGRGELVAVVGRSGSGKTTMLSIIAGLDRPTSGRLWFDGRELTGMSREELRTLRRTQMALVFQSFALLPMLTAAENVGIPMRLDRRPSDHREQRARDLLALVGLEGREHLRPQEMSGGEQQRVAIARGLANDATLLLADEPTGQLDAATGAQIMGLLRTIVHAEGMTGIVATHDKALIDLADRVLTVKDGQVALPV
jgi:putative ABC transport system ATP-binding protein